jgi:Ca2+-binding RTX toxin-like protein
MPTIKGTTGNDFLDGTSGFDQIWGFAGDDTIEAGAGNDWASGGDGNDWLFGDVGRDTLLGDAGDDVLDGGAGADNMSGGTGNDTYWVDDLGDVVTENAGEGIDTVNSYVNYTLPANVEYLFLKDGGTASSGIGNDLNNFIIGNSYNNFIDGRAGADLMMGGAGNDIYRVDSAGDVVIENAGEGVDLVISSITYTLGANLENLTLSGSADINGTGNTLNNLIQGNEGNNVIDGAAGTDMMIGYGGNDIYYVDNAGDVVMENPNQGIDTVYVSIDVAGYTYWLGDNVENLTLTGSADIGGQGNALHNVILGNSGNNYLLGGAGHDWIDGGDGADYLNEDYLADGDTLIGGPGNDQFRIHDADTVVIERPGEGVDVLTTTVSYALPAGSEVETLRADDYLLFTTGITLTGNEFNNNIIGGMGPDVITGGLGVDILTGEGAPDTFVWSFANETGVTIPTMDVITDFTPQYGDIIDLHAIDANELAAGDQDFTFIGDANAGFTAPGQVGFIQAGGDTFIVLNTDGDPVGDAVIRVAGLLTPDASWLHL